MSKKAVKITPKMWQELEPKWRDIARRTRMWLWKLDASLPGRLGKFGDWLNQAEEMLEIEPENQEDHIEMADQLLKLLNEHKVCLLVTLKTIWSCNTTVYNKLS